jgi:LacI family transcriptional regulator
MAHSDTAAASAASPASAAEQSGGRIRIVDLAAELDLSVATVSRALSNSPAVRPEVAERVRNLAVTRGYVPNRLARSLRSRSQTFVGFLVPDVQNLAYSIAAAACAQHVAESGNQMILAISGDDTERELQAVRSLAEAQVGGIIVAPSREVSAESRRLLSGLKVVEFNRTVGLSRDMVLCDAQSAFAEATRHLLDLGHQRIGYIGSTDVLSNGRERVEGVRQEMRRQGSRLLERHTRLLPPTEQHGAEAARELLSGDDAPTALVVGGSNLSLGVAHAVRQLGISMPDELSLVVYGDSDWGELYSPTLTTIKAPYRDMALAVADIITGLISTEQRPPSGALRLPAELVVRDSTAAPRRTPMVRDTSRRT